jgi:hypothetical protein
VSIGLAIKRAVVGMLVLLALYGISWAVLADAIVGRACAGQQWAVHRDASLAEREGKWLAAAHLYAYLSVYGTGFCRSDEVVGGSWKFPLVEVLLRLRWGKPREVDPQIFLNSYENAMAQVDEQQEVSVGVEGTLPVASSMPKR